MTSIPIQPWSTFRPSPSNESQHPLGTQIPYHHLTRPPLSRNSSTGSDINNNTSTSTSGNNNNNFREGASSLQQQHRLNQFAAFQGNQLRHSPYATRSDNEQHQVNTRSNNNNNPNNPNNGEGESRREVEEERSNFAQTIYDPFRIKHRRRTSAAQLKILEHQFRFNPKPDVQLRKVLSEQLDMTPREVQVWFQNRRAKTKKLKEQGDKDEDDEDDGEGDEEDSPEFSGVHPSTPLPPPLLQAVDHLRKDFSPNRTPNYELKNPFEMSNYSIQNQNQNRQSLQSQTNNNTSSSFPPYPDTNYSNSTSTSISPLPSPNEPNEARINEYYQQQSRPIYGGADYGFSPTAIPPPWLPTKDNDGNQLLPPLRYHHPLTLNPDGSSSYDVQGVLGEYELLSTGSSNRPSPEYRYGNLREGDDGFSPSSSNDDPQGHHDYSSISSTNSRLFEQSRSLPSYSFSSEFNQRGGSRGFENQEQQEHQQQQQQQYAQHQQQHIPSNSQPGLGEDGSYDRRSSCPIPTFDSLGLASSPPWSMALSGPAIYSSSAPNPFHLRQQPQQPQIINQNPFNTGNFFPNHQVLTNPSTSFLNHTPINNQTINGTQQLPLNYTVTTPPIPLVRRGSATSNLVTISESTFPTTSTSTTTTTTENNLNTKSVKDAQVHSDPEDAQINSSVGPIDRNLRKAKSQHNLRLNPYSSQEKRSPNSLERRPLTAESH